MKKGKFLMACTGKSKLGLDHFEMNRIEVSNFLKVCTIYPYSSRASSKITTIRVNNFHFIDKNLSLFTLDAWKWWKNVFFFVGVPAIIMGTVNAFVLADPSELEPPPFVEYDHLRIRTKVKKSR